MKFQIPVLPEKLSRIGLKKKKKKKLAHANRSQIKE